MLFMNYFEKKLKNPNLFKRTLILIKSWCYYESGILGSNIGLLATYALEMLVIFIFNNYEIKNEIEAFFLFFKICAEISWEKELLTLFGIYEIENFKIEDNLSTSSLLDKNEFFEYLKQFEKIKEFDKQSFFTKMMVKYFNILDPIFSTNNLGKSVNFHNFSKIKKVFEIGHKDCLKIQKIKNEKNPFFYLNSLLKLFNKSLTNNYPEILFLNLLQPKILISVSNKKSTNSEIIEKNNFFTISEISIKEFNKKFGKIDDLKLVPTNIYVTKDIIDYFLGQTNQDTTIYDMYYDIAIIEKLFNDL
jgi:hypothetical protein